MTNDVPEKLFTFLNNVILNGTMPLMFSSRRKCSVESPRKPLAERTNAISMVSPRKIEKKPAKSNRALKQSRRKRNTGKETSKMQGCDTKSAKTDHQMPMKVKDTLNLLGSQLKCSKNLQNRNKKYEKDTDLESVELKENNTTGEKKHDLRMQKPKRYVEDDSTFNDSTTPKRQVPIYRTLQPEKPKETKVKDVYEFDESEIRIGRIRQKRSSIPFDKDTHDILKRIEFKEAKAKKQHVLKKKKTKYEDIVTNILSNVKEKILQKKKTSSPNQENSLKPHTNKNVHPTTPIIVISDITLNNSAEDHHLSPTKLSTETSTSNKSMQEYQLSPTEFLFEAPTSTPVTGQQLNGMVQTPWRPEFDNIQRNPHFITVKSNALPSLNQEMVITHSLVDKYNSSATTPKRLDETHQPKHSVQTSMFDYVNCENKEAEKQVEASLFDYGEFNDIGQKASTPLKRTVLGDLTNTKCFGFDTCTEESFQQSPRKPDEVAKPTRIDLSQLRKYVKKKKPCKINFNESNSSSMANINITENNDQDQREVKLFDEPEEILDMDLKNMMDVEIRKPRRKRADSWDSNASDCDRKRKKKKTKHDEELEAFVKDFNDCCKEVEQYELEID